MYSFQQKNNTKTNKPNFSSSTKRFHVPAFHDARIYQREERNMPIQRRSIDFCALELDTKKPMAVAILTHAKLLTNNLDKYKEYIKLAIAILSELKPEDEDEGMILSDTIAILRRSMDQSKDLPDADIDALKDWTGGAWSPINLYLRKDMTEQLLEPYQTRKLTLGKYGRGNLDERVFAIDSALDKMKPCSSAVYRYSDVRGDFFEKIKVGDYLYDAGYTATSTVRPESIIKNKSTKEEKPLSQITFAIFTFPKETHNGKDISEFSTSPGEAEVLLDRGGCYQISDIHTKDGVGYVTLVKAMDMDFSNKTIRHIYTGDPIDRQAVSKNIEIADTQYSYAPDEIPRDGNCFFNAVIAAAGLQSSSTVLRNALADQYPTRNIRRNGIWAQREDIAHLAEYLGLRIEVFLINEGNIVYDEGFGTSDKIVKLALENNHFSPLTKV